MISVIVPVYNCEKYIARCLDSILNQTYRDLEVLIINDGSTDASGEIIRQYAAKDSRIRYFEQENQGVSVARNIGLEYATGEYVQFIDADDWLDEDCLETLQKLAARDGLECVSYGFRLVYEDGSHVKSDQCTAAVYHYQLNNEKEVVQFLENQGRAVFYTSCQHLFKLSIIREHKLSFAKGIICGEDGLFAHVYALFVHKGCILQAYTGYNYFQHAQSCTHTNRDCWFIGVDQKIKHCQALKTFLEGNGRAIQKSHLLASFSWDLLLHAEIAMCKCYDPTQYRKFRQSDCFKKILCPSIFSAAPLRRKILLLVCLVSRKFFCRIIGI